MLDNTLIINKNFKEGGTYMVLNTPYIYFCKKVFFKGDQKYVRFEYLDNVIELPYKKAQHTFIGIKEYNALKENL